MAGPKLELLLAAQDQTGSAFDSLNRNLSNLQSSSTALQGGLGKLSAIAEQARTAFVALGGALLIDKALAFNKEVQSMVGGLKDQADAVGVTTTQLQAYQAAIRDAGGHSENWQKILGTFNEALGKAAAGEKTAAQAFIDLKVKILDQNGNLRDNAVLLTESSQALLGIDNAGQRAAISTALFSREGKTITPILREFAKGSDDLTARFQALGLIVGGETIEAMDRLNKQSDTSWDKIKKLYAVLSAAPLATGFGAVAAQMQEMANSVALIDAHQSGLDKLMEAVNIMAGGLSGTLAGQSAQARALNSITEGEGQVVDARKHLAEVDDFLTKQGAALSDQRKAKRRQEAADAVTAAENTLTGLQNVYRKFLQSKPGGIASPTGGNALYGDGGLNATVPGTPGGAKFAQPKTEGRDRIGEEIQKLQAQAAAATAELGILKAGDPSAVLSDLERQAELEKKIGDIVADSGKYAKNDPRIQSLRDQATAAAMAEQAFTKFKASLELADSTNAKYGDGVGQFNKTQHDLNDALATGRLNQDAYTAAMIEATHALQDQQAKSKQFAEGWDGIAGGIQYAALQSARANSAFNQGTKIWQTGTQLIKSELDNLATGAEFSFGRIAQGFAKMLSDMAFQAASNQIGQALFGGSGGGGGGLLSSLFSGQGIQNLFATGNFGGVTSSAIGGADGFAGLAEALPLAFADGGRPPVGVPSLVGERGKELFVPDTAGTIIPNHALGGGSGTINLVITLDNDMLNAQVDDRVSNAAPGIVHVAVNRSRAQVVPMVNADKQQRGGEWRLGAQ